MTRLRPAGSFSSRKFSPWWNRIGGVDRSTSSTNPGRGISGPREGDRVVPRDGTTQWETRERVGGGLGGERRSSAHPPQVEGDLQGAAGAGVGGVVDGVLVAGEGIGGGDQAA